MSDWEIIKSGENGMTLYCKQREGQELAICHSNWRNGGTLAPRTLALMSFYLHIMQELWAKYEGLGHARGALIDFAISHRDYEVWFNGEMC